MGETWFHSALKARTLSIPLATWRSCLPEKSSGKNPFNLLGKAHIRSRYPALCRQTPGHRLLDTRCAFKESARFCRELHTMRWPESTDFLALRRMTCQEPALPRCLDGLVYLGPPLLPLSFMQRQRSCPHLPNPCTRRNRFLTRTFHKQPPRDPMTNQSCHSLLLKGGSFWVHKSLSFMGTTKGLWVPIHIHGLWICKLPGCVIG